MNKSTWISLVILLVLVLIGLFYKEGSNDGEVMWKTYKNPIDKIIITKAEKTILLIKKDESWQVGENGYLSDKVKLGNILTILTNEIRFELISSYTNSYSKYGLDVSDRIEIIGFFDGKEVRKLIIGDISSSQSHTYMIASDDGYVYQATGDFKKNIDIEEENDLRDKQMLSFQKNELSSIEIFDAKGKSKTITKKTLLIDDAITNTNQSAVPQEVWVDEKDNKLKENKVNEIINGLSSLKADGFAAKSFEDYSKDKFIRKFIITTTSSRNTLWIVGDFQEEDESKAECIIEKRKTGFIITEEQKKIFLISHQELIE